MKQRLFNLLLAIDSLLYVILTLGNGSPLESCSSAAWRLEQEGKPAGKFFRPRIDWLFAKLGDDNHCQESFENLKRMKYLPEFYKT
jgi:hypothetical protein